MPEFLTRPWPWYIGGPIIGLMVPALLLLGNKAFGVASNLRHLCAACFPSKGGFSRYHWKKSGGWSLAFLLGTLLGGVIGGRLRGGGSVALSNQTPAALTALGLHDQSGLVPREALSWTALATGRTVWGGCGELASPVCGPNRRTGRALRPAVRRRFPLGNHWEGKRRYDTQHSGCINTVRTLQASARRGSACRGAATPSSCT